MLIIGCDFHSRFQQIAMLDPQTGEVIEHRLEHENGEARKFYAGLATPARVGMEATGYAQWFERMLAEQGHQLWGRRCGGDPCGDGAQAENGLAGCLPYSRPAAQRQVSADLDSVHGGARCATTVAAPL